MTPTQQTKHQSRAQCVYFRVNDMKLFRLILGIVAISAIKLNAAFVNVSTAKSVAVQFLNLETGIYVDSDKLSLHKELGINNQPLLYIFNSRVGEMGTFVIVSADDLARPILGYSLHDTFSIDLAPDHVMAWLSDYERSIIWGIQNNISQTEDIKQLWDYYRNQKNIIGKRRGSVAPIVKAKWNQVPYYNDLCPLDGNKRSVVGCVATAMAQVIHHWQYPAKGSGFHSYSHSSLGTISANFGNTSYNYSNMPNSISSKNSDVAILNFHCGVGVEMNYSAQSSGSYVISAASPITHCAEYALKKYFSYPSTVNGQLRSNYTTSVWTTKVDNEIDNGRPIIYAGFGNGGGHAFIFDGYDNSGKYHINWGWGGAYNGYFEMDALNPDGLGTGGGTGSYNSGHQAIFGVEPPDNTTTDASISVYANVSIDASRVSYGQPFTVTTNAANVSGKDFTGSVAIAVFDDSFNFVEFVGEMNNLSLKDNYAFNSLTFESEGSLAMLPGDYHLYLCYKNNSGDWKIANDYSSYTNYAGLEIYYYSDIELYQDLNVTSGKIRNGEKTTVTFNVANTATSTFKGSYAVALYNMDGSFAQLIGSIDDNSGLPSNSYYTNNLELTSPDIDVDPGTYLLAVQYQKLGFTNWTLVGSYYKVNPIKVIVEEAPIKADPYEVNNEVVDAYLINTNYTNNNFSWNSTISNIHQESDVDYYRVDFEKNYQYSLEVKVSDLNKTFNANSYSLDSRFALSEDGVFWSMAYANEMTKPLTVNGNEKEYVLIRVVPAFAGLTGDYNLNINLQRESNASVNPILKNYRVYPNPASESLLVSGGHDLAGSQYQIFTLKGNCVLDGTMDSQQSIRIANLPIGLYYLQIQTKEGNHQIQFIKQ